MTATETKQPTTTSLWAEFVMFLVFFVVLAGGVILLWIGWIDESFAGPYSGTRSQKLTAWSIFAILGLLMAFPKYMELRSLKTGSSQAQKQFQSVRLAADSSLGLAVCLGCAYLIAVMLPASWGLEESPGLATDLVVTVAILAIMAVYVCLRALWNDAEPGARIAVAAFLVLAPVGYLLFSAIMSAIFIDIIVPAAVWLVRPLPRQQSAP